MRRCAGRVSLKLWVLSSSLVLSVLGVSAQNIPVGTWRTHFSYADARHLVQTEDKIFCATENGLFSRVIATGETRKLSKIDGLSDVGVTAMAYNEELEVLVIGYGSGFVDFVFENAILSLNDLATSNLDVNKQINDIAFGPSETYLATDIGILVVNTSRAVVTENFVNIGVGGDQVEVLEVVYRSDSLIIRTNDGIQVGALSQNLLDFGNWHRIPGSGNVGDLNMVESTLYGVQGSQLFTISSDQISLIVDLPDNASKLFVTAANLLTADNLGRVYRFEGSTFLEEASIPAGQVNDILVAGSTYVMAYEDQGLINQLGENLSPDGPVADRFSNFRVIGSDLYGFHAPSPFFYDGAVQQQSFSVFSDGSWTHREIEGFSNVSDVAIFNSNRYFSSIGNGLYLENEEEILGEIPGSAASPDSIITSLAAGDRLWVSSFRNRTPIHFMDSEGWQSYQDSQLFDNDFLTIDLSLDGLAWLGSASGTITVVDATSGEAELLNSADGLPSSFIDIDIGIADDAWVATTRGPVLFPDASFILFSAESVRPTFENRLLFEDEQINAVMTDGGNRIWFGTNSGLWVYDENTTEQVAVFTKENSPLPSNVIVQLDYNRRNGEVFIYTDKGMVSYRSASSVGSRDHRNVNIFPNPMRPDYEGLVGITGLARNAAVKITDLNGNLVKEVNANGGSAAWDTLDLSGRRVTTGIYFIFSSNRDGSETFVGKIAVIR